MSNKFDTKFDISIFSKRDFVWYGKHPIAFIPGDGSMNLLLPYHALEAFPYYSASYGGFCKIEESLGVDMLAVLAHWANCCFGRPIDDETLAHAKQVEARWFTPSFTPLEPGSPAPNDCSHTIEEFNNLTRGLNFTVRTDKVEATRDFDTVSMKRSLRIRKNTSFTTSSFTMPEQIRWYLEDTRQEKMFFVRLLSTPANIVSPHSARRSWDGHMKGCRYIYERRLYTPTYVYFPCVTRHSCMLVQYGTPDKIEKQWIGPYNMWLFHGDVTSAALCVGEADAEAYWQRDSRVDSDEARKSLLEKLEEDAIITSAEATAEEAMNVYLVNKAINDDVKAEDKPKCYPMPLKEILWEGKDPKQALEDLEAFDSKLVNGFDGDPRSETKLAIVRTGAVEFKHYYPDQAVLKALWRNSAEKI